MVEKHDIFVRAYVVPAVRKKKSKHPPKTENDRKWPDQALVFDTETRITPDQSLTFGVYRLCDLVGNEYNVTQEGIFFADDLPAKDLKVLEKYRQTAISDVPSFPPEFPLYDRSEFVRRIFWPAIKRHGALICGFNLPFDLARLARDWDRGDHDEWSLTMSQFPNGVENRYRPRIHITPIDSKKAFIGLATPWMKKEWKNKGKAHFLDLRTLLWALFNQSYSLRTACDNEKGPFKGKSLPRKKDHEPTGEVTPKEIEYARQDGRCTVALLNAAKQDFDRHPIDLKPYHAYSPASVAKSYLEAMGIARPAVKFKISDKNLGIAMQSYYGGRSETRVRCAEVPVIPVDFTSEYPTGCALLGLFEVLTAKRVTFEDYTQQARRLLEGISLRDCFKRDRWGEFKFFALVEPDDDILPVRTVYEGVTQNIGNNYLTSDTALWFAGCDLIASVIRGKGKVPRILKAIRMVPHGKQMGMRSVNLRGMVEINPYGDDLFCKVIEQRKLHKADEALYYWLKILANSIYGFFAELNPENKKKKVPVKVFSGEKKFMGASDVLEREGNWFFPPLASLITSAGRLLLAMAEACVQRKRGTYLFCDTDSLAIVSSKTGGSLCIPGGEGIRILSWEEVQNIVDRFISLNPYDPKAVEGSILNLVDANYVDSNPKNPLRQLHGYSIATKRYALYEKSGAADIKIVDPKAHGIGFLYPPKDSQKNWEGEVPEWTYEMWDYIVREALHLERELPSWLNVPQMMRLTITTYNVLEMLGEWEIARPYNFLFLPMVDPIYGYAFDRRADEKVLLVCPFSSHQKRWFDLECINVHGGKKYKMVDYTKSKSAVHNVVFPLQFARLLIQYREHPEAKSLAPDGTPCAADTKGLLRRAHVVAGELRYVGKETDRKWEEGDDISVLEFKANEYGRARKLVATEDVKDDIRKIGIKKCARESGFTRFFVRKLLRGGTVRRRSYEEFVRWLQGYKMEMIDI
jgi:hypothetical protein